MVGSDVATIVSAWLKYLRECVRLTLECSLQYPAVGNGRSIGSQAIYQAIAVATTLGKLAVTST